MLLYFVIVIWLLHDKYLCDDNHFCCNRFLDNFFIKCYNGFVDAGITYTRSYKRLKLKIR